MINVHLFASIRHVAKELARQLERQSRKIVFAESCTAGLAAAALAQIPGISKWLCGSVVTYQESLKQDWLHVDPQLIRKYSAVSPQVTEQMAQSVLRTAPVADFSVGITGHLEQDATNDGPRAFIVVAYRNQDQIVCTRPVCYRLREHSRINRQWEAARAALNVAVEYLHFPPSEDPCTIDWVRICSKPKNFYWNRWF